MIVFAILAFFGLFFVLLFEKGELEFYINQNFYAPALTIFFVSYTHLGLGMVFAIVILILGLYKLYYLLQGLLILALNGLLVLLFKQFLFKGMPRPTKFLDINDLNLILDYHYNSSNSFPSGHTLTAFSMAFFISSVCNKKLCVLFMMLYALLVAFSRVYLMQHFVIDVYFGMWLGVLSAFLVIQVFNKNSSIQQSPIMNYSILKKLFPDKTING